MQTYTQTGKLPLTYAAQVTGPLPSYMLGVPDEFFQNLADLQLNKQVRGQALPEYASLDESKPPALVMALLQELNHDSLEPTSRDLLLVKQTEEMIWRPCARYARRALSSTASGAIVSRHWR